MALSLSEILSVETKAQILERFLVDAAVLEMDVRGMQVERFARGYFEIESLSHEQWQAKRQEIVEGGYLDSAEDDWLTLLAAGFFQVTRVPAVRTVGKLVFTDAQSVGPVNIGVAERIAKSAGGRLFRNTEAGTIALNDSLTLEIRAEVAGAAGNVANNSITSLQTDIPGVTVTNPAIGATGTWYTTAGRDAESDSALRARCRAKWSSLGAGANADAYAWWIPEAFTSAGVEATVTRWKIDDSNPYGPGSIGIYLANSGGAALPDEVTIVNDYLQTRKPLGSGELRVQAAVVKNVAVTATIFQTGNSSAVANAGTAMTTLQNEFDLGAKLYRNEIIQRLMDVSGVYDVSLTLPAADVQLAATEVLQITPTISLG